MRETRTVSISIAKAPEEVYDYLADPRRYPEWSEFIIHIQQEDKDWVATTPNGKVRIAFTPRNPYFILDHFVAVSPDVIVYVPMRVVTNGEGSEVLFTIFRLPEMTDEQYKNDIGFTEKILMEYRIVELEDGFWRIRRDA